MSLENALGAQFRQVTEREHDGKPARVVTASRIYPTAQEDLWDAMTNKERLPRWFAAVEGTLELSGRYKIKGNAKGKITSCDPPFAFDLTWEIFFNVSWVNVRLTPQGDSTLLSLEHIIRKGRLAERHWRKYGPGATGVGWDFSFLDLGLHIESAGAAVKRTDDAIWAASADGKTFVQSCAKSWGESHIKAGEAVEIANAMAEETARFYTGT